MKPVGAERKKRPVLPSYLKLYDSGELLRRVEAGRELLASCCLCPRNCGVNRLKGERGFCRAGALARIASYNAHFGEEPPISGTRGSGTIFFSHCNMRCLFCQNFPISQLSVGHDVRPEFLARMMLSLQRRGCHNLNLVTATHYVPQLMEALYLAIPQGFRLPILHNTNGYDALETLALFKEVVDIYLPDIKYDNPQTAGMLSATPDYCQNNRQGVKEMYNQVGDLVTDEEGIATRGVIIRHLVLPGGLSDTPQVLKYIADNLSPQIHVSVMTQYFPAHRAHEHSVLKRRLTALEIKAAEAVLDELPIKNGWVQEPE